MSTQTGVIILNQIKSIGRSRFWSWGPSAFKAFSEANFKDLSPHHGGLLFRVSGYGYKGQIFIALNPQDTYDIYFGSYRAGKLTIKKSFRDIFVEDMVDLIDSEVELSNPIYYGASNAQ